MRKACLVFVLLLMGLCVLSCAGGYFVGIPRLRDRVQGGVRDSLGTEIAQTIPTSVSVKGSVKPGTYVLRAADLQRDLLGEINSSSVNDIAITITPTQLRFGVTTKGGQETTYTGVPTVNNGKFEMANMDTNNSVLNFLFPPDDLGTAIDDSVNKFLAENNLSLKSIKLGNGQITLTTVGSK